jgi:hypothetical protein
LDTSKCRPEVPGRVLNVVPKKDWNDHVRNEKSIRKVKEARNTLQTTKKREANWIGHFLRTHCLVRHIVEEKVEGKAEVRGTLRRRRKKLHDYL